MELRIDKWLWCVRLYKTRGEAAEACQGGKIKIDGVSVKASRILRGGEIIMLKMDALEKRIRVKDAPKSRVGAALVENYMEDLTSAEEYERVRLLKAKFEHREHGLGRPTKRDRRQIEYVKSLGD